MGEERPFRRRVFYIPGYDPFHPRRYRELYRKEGAAQAAISGYSLSLAPKRGGGPFGWHVQTVGMGRRAEADVEVLVWSDLVKHSMQAGIAATYGLMLRTAWVYVASGALWRLARLRKGPTIAALYPVVLLVLQALAALLLAAVVARVAVEYLPGWPGMVAGLGAGAVLGWLLLRWFRAHDNRVFAWYLMQDYAYSAVHGGANPPALEARMAEFGAKIRAAMAGDVDEVLVIGHSSGAHLGVSVLADLVREGLPERRPALAFLSLGHVVPMVSFLPNAGRLRRDLHVLSEQGQVVWVDVTAPGDGCAFALCDPVAVSGVAPAAQKWPLVLSAAFTQTLSPEKWKELRWRFFRLHFQYLCAFDRPRDYDYFQITAGPVTLADRYAGRGHSRSRIVTPLSPHVTMAA